MVRLKVELDYKSLHPNLLLIQEGLEPSTDVYGLGDTPIVDRYDLDTQRSIVKLAVLMLLNADDIDKAYNALIAKFTTPPGEPIDIRADLTREEFDSYLDAFIMHHPSLEKYMGKDEGDWHTDCDTTPCVGRIRIGGFDVNVGIE